MATENPLWGEERIANERLLKLAMRVSPRTVRKYMPRPAPGRLRGDKHLATFLRNHAKAMLACDFFVTVTARSVQIHSRKMLSCLSMEIPQQTAEAITALNGRMGKRDDVGRRSQATIEPLMITLGVIIRHVFTDGMAQ